MDSGFLASAVTSSRGKVLGLLENWRGASFADVNQQTGFGEPGKGDGMKANAADEGMEQ